MKVFGQLQRLRKDTVAVPPTAGGVIAYLTGGRELTGIASGMRSPTWPGGARQSRIIVYGVRD